MSAARGTLWAAMAAAMLGVALFSLMDVAMKQLALAIGAYSGLFWRSVIGSPLSALIWWRTGGVRWPGAHLLRLHLLRGALIAGMGWLFFFALTLLPLAEAIALSFIAPIVALFLAAALLGERLSRGAILAALMGLGGVAVILLGKLSGSYGPGALLGVAATLGSALLYAWNLVLQRQQAQLAGPPEISFFQNAVILLCLLPFAPFLLERVHPGALWWSVAGAAMLAICSQLLLSWAYARAEAQKLLALEYTAFLWASLFGWLFYREPLTLTTLAGTALIVAGCLLVAREKPEMAAHVESEIA